MWSFDFMLFITSILYMSRKFTHIIGQHNVEGRFNQTLTLSFILWKSIAQIILCLSLEGYLTTLLDSFSQSNVINQNTTSNQTGSSTPPLKPVWFMQYFLYGLQWLYVY
ncbi:uncharacterized protein DC041_0008811 [Schistosoma bovis]|uniref:Uncharacterized protein n=1 Tax=Schistosoma bovis TaxID=6184 RepID=A0A430QKX2_SCHBO|nr:uncharacterized protein DC041_0008811 [Schistosoma bovis]